MVVYGHTPVTEARWVNNTICLDTGVVFGGRLTALRYPERELVDVPAERQWWSPAGPSVAPRSASTHAVGEDHARTLAASLWQTRADELRQARVLWGR